MSAKYEREQHQAACVLEMESCGKKYTPEQIERWKDAGLTQPEWVKDSDWSFGNKLTPGQILICKSAALLMKNSEIAELTGYSQKYVTDVANSELGKLEIAQTQDRYFGENRKMLDTILPVAIKVALQVMLDPNTKAQTRADAAFRFMDRVMGRPTQHVELNDNLIRQVYEKLDSHNVIDIAEKRIENAISVVPETEKELDPTDLWVKENL